MQTQFQSQTRSRPSCHFREGNRLASHMHSFNLKREAAPVATPFLPGGVPLWREVSISNEKPPQLPPNILHSINNTTICFNLKREAAPVATLAVDTESGYYDRYVSISNEKPPQLPRPSNQRLACPLCSCFNLKREAAPVATAPLADRLSARSDVSISNEKPPQLPHSQ